ncbi:MAG: ATP-binding protein [Ferruginibacter sp.]
MHDNINQLLATTKLYLSLAGKNDEQLRRVLDFPVELIDNTIREIRMLTRKIVTSTQNVNLKELVCSLLACMYKNTLIKTHFDYTGLDDLNDDELKLNIYRIIQEQTNNITKHACAANVNISIHVFEQYVTVEIKDDGAGFDITTKKEGIGIINITNRVQSFNGEIDITSGHGKGCTLKIKIPC